jgi:hypothetical protein
MRTCERCGSEDVSWSHDITRLIGDVAASLCNPCLREFAGVIQGHPAVADRETLLARRNHYDSLATAGRPVDERAWLELEREGSRLQRVWHDVAVEFIGPVKVAANRD